MIIVGVNQSEAGGMPPPSEGTCTAACPPPLQIMGRARHKAQQGDMAIGAGGRALGIALRLRRAGLPFCRFIENNDDDNEGDDVNDDDDDDDDNDSDSDNDNDG